MTISQPLNSHTTLFLLSLLLLASGCLFGDDDEPILPVEVTDPCSIVHETYPNVREDSCSWVLRIMQEYQRPTELPPRTDTGGYLLAARILTDTGEVVFVAGGVPQATFLGGIGVCESWQSRVYPDTSGGSIIRIHGIYCYRPPVDAVNMQILFDIVAGGEFYPNSGLVFFYRDEKHSRRGIRYNSKSEDSTFNFVVSRIDTLGRYAVGSFSGTLYNQDDTTKTIEILEGYFDARF